jgi:hypothetical protein
MGVTEGTPNQRTSSESFDKKSIMLYASWMWSEKQDGGVGEVAMVAWKTPGHDSRPPKGTKPTDDNAMLIPENNDVSDQDREFVQKFYPWTT